MDGQLLLTASVEFGGRRRAGEFDMPQMSDWIFFATVVLPAANLVFNSLTNR